VPVVLPASGPLSGVAVVNSIKGTRPCGYPHRPVPDGRTSQSRLPSGKFLLRGLGNCEAVGKSRVIETLKSANAAIGFWNLI
jgi:hypothetical protein